MKFEYIILLILAFNVVTALVKKRKDRAAQIPPPKPRAEAQGGEAREEMGRARDSRESRAPGYRSGGAAERAAGRTDNRDGEDLESLESAPAKKTGMGRDLLEQIAKELGLETSQPERPRAEVAYRPEAVARETVPPEVVAVVPPGTARTPRKVAPRVAAVEPAAPLRRAPAMEMRDLEGLRRAFIAKEVLGPPVSRVRASR